MDMNHVLWMTPFYVAGTVALILAILCFFKKDDRGRLLGLCITGAFLTSFTYSASVLLPGYFAMSLASSLYYCSTDLVVISLFLYTVAFINPNEKFAVKKWMFPFLLYFLFDVVIMLINPFVEIVGTYDHYPDSLVEWRLVSYPMHTAHLIFTYLTIACVLAMMLSRCVRVPRVYRPRYMRNLIGLVVTAVMSVIYVMIPNRPLVDFSIIFYAILGGFYYWNDGKYTEKYFAARIQHQLFDDLGRAMVLFDYENYFALANKDAEQIIHKNSMHARYSLMQFLKDAGLSETLLEETSEKSFLWTAPSGMIYRCDFRPFTDERQRLMGRLFTFTDVSLEIDLLTGFSNRMTMDRYYLEESHYPKLPAAVVVCDLNQLAELNRIGGEAEGDAAIRLLADLMRKHCPVGSFFARLEDANLLAVLEKTDTYQARRLFEDIRKELQAATSFSMPLDMQSALCMVTVSHPDMSEAVTNAIETLRTKKMLDSSSAHASLLSSLAQAQNESDPTTEEHVQRTRLMGDMLGRKMGLSDSMLNDLSLLCLLHDIGKLGVPLEILNKPGRLSPAEWDVMRSHVEKGYNIAMVSKELSGIAELILHHHECWDGSGYPDGLKQESIPLLSRIIAVVDSYDAMTNDRPYRKGISVEQAVTELRSCAGTQFDPNVVATFVQLLKEMYPDAFRQMEDEQQSDHEKRPSGAYSQARMSKQEFTDKKILEFPMAEYTVDEKGVIIEANAFFFALTGYQQETLDKGELKEGDLVFAEDRLEFETKIAIANEANVPYSHEFRLRRKDGFGRYVLSNSRMHFDPITLTTRVIVNIIDIGASNSLQIMLEEERKHAQHYVDRWESVIRRDSLTGLLNHGAFYSDAELRLLKDTKRYMLLVMDLDNFKMCNDTYGHIAGDELLEVMAHELENAIFKDGIVGRMGGDEFAALVEFPIGTEEAVMTAHAEGIRQRIIAGLHGHVGAGTVSMGATFSGGDAHTITEMYKIADEALYDSKFAGKNRLTVKN